MTAAYTNDLVKLGIFSFDVERVATRLLFVSRPQFSLHQGVMIEFFRKLCHRLTIGTNGPTFLKDSTPVYCLPRKSMATVRPARASTTKKSYQIRVISDYSSARE
jgi:hypothetical protein